MSCTGNSVRCPGATGRPTNYTSGSPCTWTRKLCVTCSERNNKVYIKVQTNGLPNHCINSTVNNANPEEREWEVRWQPPVNDIINYSTDSIDSSAKTDELLCDIQRTKKENMLSVSEFTISSEGRRTDPISTAAGVAFSGMMIFSSLAGGNTDALDFEIKTLDSCLNHPSPTGSLHYHYWSPCVRKGYGFSSQTEAPVLCADSANDECMSDPSSYVTTKANAGQVSPYADTNDYGGVVGLAKDGHVIVGPYNK